ncbi:hypothetical protein PENANT_c062G00148 [Penicillium antarcticum]|uniref:Uncharacterized protein n=1 Tax=Penicillium antarcticum TaxID=416450 RepID=A0A1V6PRD7_9EURO|nr:uncharacterized protein N7508_006756 [Penicillium antarcticum]KAJ5301893.1 hypothetical protein N7508_006756 [Penicillium antarcticum]OQD79096.1 hypothetical protein PENANT_c062G00148 [Penicillium antarcticum]
MKVFNIVLVAIFAAITIAAAVADPEAALADSIIEKRCKATGNACTLGTQCCNGACVATGVNKFAKHCN